MKDDTAGFAIEEFVRLKPKMYLFLVDNSSEYKKAQDVYRNVVATISHNEYKDILLNNKCLRRSINKIQSKNHKIETYEINKISLSSFDDKIYALNNGYNDLLVVILIIIENSFFSRYDDITLIFFLV